MSQFPLLKRTSWFLMIFSILLMGVMSCNQDTSLNAYQDYSYSDSAIEAKKIKTTTTSTTTSGIYPQTGSCTMYYEFAHNAYDGGNFTIMNGSSFTVGWASLTPPPGTPLGANVTVQMTVEKDTSNNALIFSFGPSGCQFNPEAELWLKWSDLGGNGTPNLFYIDTNGNYIPQTPDRIDRKRNRLMISIPHFSRYAVAFSQ